MKKLIIIFAVVMMMLAVSVPAQAALLDVRVDFQNGGAVPAGNWNDIEWSTYGTTTSGLTDYNTGLATSVATVGTNWGSFDWGETWSPPVDWVETAAAIDGFAGAVASTQTFSGLDTLKNYKVEVVSAESGLPNKVTFTINGSYADTNYYNTMTGNVSLNWDMVAARTNQDWLIWSSIAPDINGDLVISQTTRGDWGVINAIKISEVPEPGTLVMLAGLSVMLAIGYRRRGWSPFSRGKN